MQVITLDVVMVLPPHMRAVVVDVGNDLATLLDEAGHRAAFRLGRPFPGEGGGVCEPHVSLFMMAVEETEVPSVVDALTRIAAQQPPIDATGVEYRYNKEGAPELFYEKSDQWRRLQSAIISEVEPLRRGRLREFGPGGERLAQIVEGRDPEDPARVRQLLQYGYDDVSDEVDDRLSPHVTLTWPADDSTFRVDLSRVPPPSDFTAALPDLALYGMSPKGTCTREYGRWTLGAKSGPAGKVGSR